MYNMIDDNSTLNTKIDNVIETVLVFKPLHIYPDVQCDSFYKRERDYPTLRETIRKRR